MKKNVFCLHFNQITISTEYHKNNKTQIVERLNMNTKIVFSLKNLGYTSFNIQRKQNHKQIFYCDLRTNHSFLRKSQ